MVMTSPRQFQVWTLRQRQARGPASPTFILVIQSRRLEDLGTLIAAPLFRSSETGPIGKVRPEIVVSETPYRIQFDRMAVLDKRDLADLVMDASPMEWAFKSALDELFF
jgi:hypothetical protein